METKKIVCGAVIVALLFGIYYLWSSSSSSCGCGSDERFGPKYKKEKFGSHRKYEQGSLDSVERFSDDFTSAPTTQPIPKIASAQSPFVGSLSQMTSY